MKKIMSLTALAAIIALSGCSQMPVSGPATAITPSYLSTGAVVEAQSSDESDAQEKVFSDNYDIWNCDESFSTWYYAFTDLDHNGLNEVITQFYDLSDGSTKLNIYEVGSDMQGIEECALEIEKDELLSAAVADSASCFYDFNNNTYYFTFEKLDGNEATDKHTKFALYLKDGVLHQVIFATQTAKDDGVSIIYKDSDGNLLDRTGYTGAEDNYFRDHTRSKVYFNWYEVDSAATEDIEEDSVDSDTGTSSTIVITKSPSSECINAGEDAWFIAHADNADTLTWLFRDKKGNEYSLDEAIDINSGLAAEILPGDSLHLTGIPLSMNAWRIIAEFSADDGTARTEPIKIVVGDYLKMYDEVISTYSSADFDTADVIYSDGVNLFSGDKDDFSKISPIVKSLGTWGYYFKDMNKDLVPELLIAGNFGTSNDEISIIADMFTVNNGNIKRIAVSCDNIYYYLAANGNLRCRINGGDYDKTDILLKLNGDKLTVLDAVRTMANSAGTGEVYLQGEILEGNEYKFETRVTAGVYSDKLDSFGDALTIPFKKLR